MSDIQIPGVSSSIDTKSMIEALVKVERTKLTRKNNEVQSIKDQKKAWQDVRLSLVRLQDSSKKLYGFQNPFDEKIANSGDQNVIFAEASREAQEGSYSFIVEKIATSDRFLSRSLPRTHEVPAGDYRFQVGDEKWVIPFKGGSLRDLADGINKKGRGVLKSSVVKDTEDSHVLLIESTRTGIDNRLQFQADALEFGIQSGMLESIGKSHWEQPILEAALAGHEGYDSTAHKIISETLNLQPLAGEIRIPLPRESDGFEQHPNMILEIDIRVGNLPIEPWAPPPLPPGPELSTSGEVEFEGIRLENENSQFPLPPWDAPDPPAITNTGQIFFVDSGGTRTALPNVNSSDGDQKIQISLGDLPDSAEYLVLSNPNTHREVTVNRIRIFDPAVREGQKPLKPLSEAGDAVITMEGIRITRKNNEIDDVVPGVKLTLTGSSDKPITVSIDKDIDAIKNDIIELVGYYNRLLNQIDILSRNDSTVIDEAVYLSDDERADAENTLGLLQGDMSLAQLKRNLRNIMMNPYSTRANLDLSLLAQVGISTDAARVGFTGTVDKSRLRGYLEIDEGRLTDSLLNRPQAVKDLFGYDRDGDYVIDSGAAFTMDANIKPYVIVGGLIANKMTYFDSTIDRRNRDISNFEDYLADYEAKLKRKYGMMEGMLQNLQANAQAIENFSKSNSGND